MVHGAYKNGETKSKSEIEERPERNPASPERSQEARGGPKKERPASLVAESPQEPESQEPEFLESLKLHVVVVPGLAVLSMKATAKCGIGKELRID